MLPKAKYSLLGSCFFTLIALTVIVARSGASKPDNETFELNKISIMTVYDHVKINSSFLRLTTPDARIKLETGESFELRRARGYFLTGSNIKVHRRDGAPYKICQSLKPDLSKYEACRYVIS